MKYFFLVFLFLSCKSQSISFKDPLPSKEEQELIQEGFLWPVPASKRITSQFNAKRKLGKHFRYHKGLDIGAPKGTPVIAAKEGIVVTSGVMRGYGNVIMIRHFEDPKIITIYAHNSKNIAKRGFFVEKGEVIAYVGSTGRSTGNHLHFEMRKDEKVVDPLAYVNLENDQII
jgi:murein DD-endopeptidase MepM/ murein hydrolase activator NlpD